MSESHVRSADSLRDQKKNRRHRRHHREHRHNPCPHRPRQLDADSELYAEFQRHPHPFTGQADADQTKKLHKGRKRHNGWVARLRWEEVDTDSDGFPINVIRYQVEVELSADGTDWFFASRHHTPAKDDCDPGEADHIVIHHIHGNLAYRWRVRAIGNNCKADWSDYYLLGTPDDGPPAPFDVRIIRASHGIRVKWHADAQVDDDEIFTDDIAYFVAELWTNEDFGPSLDFTADASTDTLTTSAHGMSDGDLLMLSGTDGGPSLPGGTHPWKAYKVNVLSTTTFKLKHEETGSVVDLTSDGDGRVHIGLVRKARHVHKHQHRFRLDPKDFDEDVHFFARVRSHSDHHAKSAWIPATGDGNDDPDATPSGRRPLWHRHGGLTFTIPGRVQQKIYQVPHRIEDDYIIRRVTAAANIPGSGGVTRFDVKVNDGPYVFDLMAANQVTLHAGDRDASSKNIVNETLSRGDHVRVRCVDLAPTSPRDVTVHIVADRLSPGELAATDSGGGGGQTLLLLAAKGRSQTTSDLFDVAPDASGESSIGALGFALTSITQDPTSDIVYASTSNNSAASPHALITVDPITGDGTLVAGFSSGYPMPGLAVAADGTMYGVNSHNPGAGADFSSIDMATAVETVIGSATIPNAGTGLAFDDSGTLWGMDYSDIGTIDPGTGVFTSLFSVTGLSGNAILGLSFFDGVLWGLDQAASNTSDLFTVDLSTGTISIVGTLSTTYLDALGWVVF